MSCCLSGLVRTGSSGARSRQAASRAAGMKGIWNNEINVLTPDDGAVTEWRVDLMVSFGVD